MSRYKVLQRLFLTLSAVLILGVANAKYVKYTPELKKAHSLLVQLKFDEASAIIEKASDENAVKHYLQGAQLLVRLFISEDEDFFKDQLDFVDDKMSIIEDLDDEEPYRAVMLSEMHLAKAILHGKYKNYIKSAWNFYKAFHLLENNYEEFPSFIPNYVPLGVLYTATGSLPEDYKSVAGLFGIGGDTDQGIKLIKKGYWRSIADEDASFYREYYGFIYSYIKYYLDPEDKSVTPKTLGLDFESSSFLIYMQCLADIKEGNNAQALEYLLNRPMGEGYYPFNYLDYFTGKTALPLQPDTAVYYFKQYLSKNGEGHYVKSTYRYLAWYELLYGDDAAYRNYLQLISTRGQAKIGADKQAMTELEEGFNKTLISARLLYDAGAYAKAVEFMEGIPQEKCCTTDIHRVEYYYRLGRSYQGLERYEKAIINFQKALTGKLKDDTYALGTSALQLGIIYEDQGKSESATKYFKLCLKYDDYPFYEGNHQRAKAGLSRLDP